MDIEGITSMVWSALSIKVIWRGEQTCICLNEPSSYCQLVLGIRNYGNMLVQWPAYKLILAWIFFSCIFLSSLDFQYHHGQHYLYLTCLRKCFFFFLFLFLHSAFVLIFFLLIFFFLFSNFFLFFWSFCKLTFFLLSSDRKVSVYLGSFLLFRFIFFP